MNVTITPKNLQGEVSAIPSKSVAHRALICAALSDKPTKINNLFSSLDILATKECISALGAKMEDDTVYPIKKVKRATLPCNESGSTLRFMLPLALSLGGEFEFDMRGRLKDRPLSPLYEELESHGAMLSPQGENPLKASGRLKSGIYNLPGNISSQFITGLLLALPILDGDSEIRISGEMESAPYVDITRDIQSKFSVTSKFENNIFYIKGNQKYKSPMEFTVEGDWSNAAFWFSANQLSDGEVLCSGVSALSAQGDKEIINILKNLPCEIDARNIPDLIPVVCTVAALKEGETRIFGAKRLAIKESNRLVAVRDMICALGGDITLTDDGMIIKGKNKLAGGVVNSYNDHRIVMSAAVASIKCLNSVTIIGAEAANKSYPAFFEDFKKLGGEVKEEL